jgi:hypothetical protein
MRLILPESRALLERKRRRVNYTVEVLRGATWVNLKNLYGREWVKSLQITEDIDSPSMELQFEVQREWEKTSLSPLMEFSRVNRVDVAGTEETVPVLELDSRVVVWVSISSEESFSENWMQIFDGRITNVDPAGSTIKVVARDRMHDLVTTWIETKEQQLGSTDGTPVETLIQGILDAWAPGITLQTPVSPNWLVNLYKQERMPVYEALNTIVLQFGWDLRFRYSSIQSNHYLTLYEPGRDRLTDDYTFGPDDYYDLSGMSLNLDGVRNVVNVGAGPNGARVLATAESAASLTKYRIRRVMWIEEDPNSPIQTVSQAGRMATSALSDLSFPKYAMGCTMPIFPWVQLGDRYHFEPNYKQFDAGQTFSVGGYTHEIRNGKATTTLRMRDGQPSAAYGRWLRREHRRGVKFL